VLNPDEEKELDIRFTYHAPKEGQQEKYVELRGLAKQFAIAVMNQCPVSREQSLALTKIEEAVMWANSAIARRS
jgi:hypothetical protein